MKYILSSLTLATALVFSARAADVSVKLTDVHLCCDSCVKGANKAVSKVSGVTVVADKDDETVTIKASDKATAQKAVDALVAAGYFGKSADPDIKVVADSGAKDQKVQTLQVDGVHLCCGQCVKSVNRALEGVAGVKANTAVKNAKSFTVTGDFNEKALFDALEKEGLSGKVGK